MKRLTIGTRVISKGAFGIEHEIIDIADTELGDVMYKVGGYNISHPWWIEEANFWKNYHVLRGRSPELKVGTRLVSKDGGLELEIREMGIVGGKTMYKIGLWHTEQEIRERYDVLTIVESGNG